MENREDEISFEEVLDSEIDDIWDIFFPYMAEKRRAEENNAAAKTKPTRNLRFLSM